VEVSSKYDNPYINEKVEAATSIENHSEVVKVEVARHV